MPERYEQLVEELIAEHRAHPVDMLRTGDNEGEVRYLDNHKTSFARTLRDVDRALGGARERRVLELGAFLGAVSVPLAQLGYRVDALDIPEFHASAELRALYERHGIAFAGVNLRNYRLPYPDASFDAVIACEILEHLNFNPLPVMQELNRVMRPGALLYIGMPNQAALHNRLRLALGRSIHPPIDEYFAQLDRRSNMVVGLHWREYTVAESKELLERTGFELARAYYFAEPVGWPLPLLWLRDLVYAAVPVFKPYQVVLGRKAADVRHDFWLTEANR